jgi:hypothetical protein
MPIPGSLDPRTKNSNLRTIAVRFDTDQMIRIQKLADHYKISFAAMVRVLVLRGLKDESQPTASQTAGSA